MPKLWSETIETHRRDVRNATLDATAELVAKHGLHAVTMSQIAEEAGIGRATLYKYFADIEAILVAWHERHVTAHLAHLAQIRKNADGAEQQLEAVLEAYAFICYELASKEHFAPELTTLMHRGRHVRRAYQQLHDLIRDILTETAKTGGLRDDMAPNELAGYCLHALTAAGNLRSKAAVQRLVAVTLAGMRTPR